jgi:peptidyl-prolyl cis-trans isomerase C
LKFIFLIGPVLAGLFILANCTPPHKRVMNQPVVQVDASVLTAKEFAEKLVQRLKNLDALAAKDPNNVRRSKDGIIADFILEAMTLRFAKAESIEVNDQELEAEINSFRSSYPDDLAFRRVLAEEGLALADWKEGLRKTLVKRKVIAKISSQTQGPKEEEVQKYFQENKEKFKRAERVFIRQIVVDDLPKAEAIREEAKKKDFSTLAKKYSVAPEGKFGGEVGWVEKGTVDIFDKAFQLSIGGLSPVLESSYGFHIFKVERRAAAGYASVAEVRNLIEQSLKGQREQAAFSAWLDQQIRQSRVLRDNSLIDSMKVETLGKE